MTKSNAEGPADGSDTEPGGKPGKTSDNGRNAGPEGDSDRLARDFLTLWQEQLRLLADDPTAARAMAETMALWQRMGMMAPFMAGTGQAGTGQAGSGYPGLGGAAMNDAGGMANSMAGFVGMPGFGAGFPNPFAPPPDDGRASRHSAQHHEGGQHADPDTATGADAPDRPTAAAASSDGGLQLLRELDRRLARIEERFDRLESELGGAGGKPQSDAGGKRRRAAKSPAKKSRAKSATKKSPARKQPAKRKS